MVAVRTSDGRFAVVESPFTNTQIGSNPVCTSRLAVPSPTYVPVTTWPQAGSAIRARKIPVRSMAESEPKSAQNATPNASRGKVTNSLRSVGPSGVSSSGTVRYSEEKPTDNVKLPKSTSVQPTVAPIPVP
jgi:hypothetical protein